jgi:putative FmdB family regulatory protein
MPIYEYRCEPCEHTFETLIRGASDVARCPRCGNIQVAKQFSVPAAAQSSRTSSLPICGDRSPASYGCGRPECGSGSCAFG